MIPYKEIIFEKSAEKFYRKQPTNQRVRILKAIKHLPETGDIKKLKGFDSLYRLRVGDYRILYTIDRVTGKVLINVIEIDNRGQVYK